MGNAGASDHGSGRDSDRSGGVTEWLKVHPLGISVTPFSASQAAAVAAGALSGKRFLLNHNLHSAYLHDTDHEFRELYQRADWVVIDGTPILWLASLSSRRRLRSSLRFGSTDWIEKLPEVEVSPRRLFVFGATTESNARAIENLRIRLPNWEIRGIDGYVAEELAIEHIVDFQPHLVVVGLGMPRQERFLLRNYARLPEATYATVGGAIDYIAGTNRLAPRWAGIFGAEWLWRLLCEPRRLWHRYLVEPFLLFGRVAARSLCERPHP